MHADWWVGIANIERNTESRQLDIVGKDLPTGGAWFTENGDHTAFLAVGRDRMRLVRRVDSCR